MTLVAKICTENGYKEYGMPCSWSSEQWLVVSHRLITIIIHATYLGNRFREDERSSQLFRIGLWSCFWCPRPGSWTGSIWSRWTRCCPNRNWIFGQGQNRWLCTFSEASEPQCGPWDNDLGKALERRKASRFSESEDRELLR